MDYKVLITTSGTGSRLKELTKYLNKSLVRIGRKPAISYIIESYPKDVVLVITIGYLGDQMKEFLLMAYPDRKFEFVKVDKYEGEGSSLGFSMLHAKNNLQCPFIFHSCDTIVTESIPAPDKNWVAGYMYDKSSGQLDANQYRTHKIVNEEVVRLNEKGDPDFKSIHIGLIGVKDYRAFWRILTQIYENDPANTGHSDVHVVDKMIKSGHKFDLVAFNNWYDTGNPVALEKTRQQLGDDFKILDKTEESIFIFDKFVIKFFANPQMVKNRVARARVLNGLVPEIEEFSEHFYRYKYVEGDLYARVVDVADFKQFLLWTKNNLWKKTNTVSTDQFKSACLDFYKNKTLKRVKKFLADNNTTDKPNIINGERVPAVSEIMNKIDFERLATAEQYMIHGDFILDNIIKTKDGYCLLDWRQDFGGLIEAGDMYYDLAKMNHNLTVNHDLINENQFSVKVDEDKVELAIAEQDNLRACHLVLRDFVAEQGLDWQKVELLTGIIWLNMAPLHPVPPNFNLFLFYLGKLTIWKTLKKITNFVLDFDGVFTTGQFLYTKEGKYAKVCGAHDNDGIKMIKKFVDICIITADKRGLEITKQRVEDMGLRLEVVSEAERLGWMKANFDLSKTAYMGDGIHDLKVFPFVAYSIAPSNAFHTVCEKANYVTKCRSGEGAVLDACLHLLDIFLKDQN